MIKTLPALCGDRSATVTSSIAENGPYGCTKENFDQPSGSLDLLPAVDNLCVRQCKRLHDFAQRSSGTENLGRCGR